MAGFSRERDARSKKLIDEIGGLQDAIQITAKMAKITGEPHLVYPARERTGLLDLVLGRCEPCTSLWGGIARPTHSVLLSLEVKRLQAS